ncbi:uncharacterized protein LOC131643708 [Vicia villosa]|uniref:uncharacterized protein LOC131643708 n=1 Tax=Vicia villosa TaxID=3911 RepID=UPI00273AD087|nr:uncharacterized protein LOC131643708 [Vicia villosa]
MKCQSESHDRSSRVQKETNLELGKTSVRSASKCCSNCRIVLTTPPLKDRTKRDPMRCSHSLVSKKQSKLANHRGAVDAKSGGNYNQSNGNDVLFRGSSSMIGREGWSSALVEVPFMMGKQYYRVSDSTRNWYPTLGLYFQVHQEVLTWLKLWYILHIELCQFPRFWSKSRGLKNLLLSSQDC